MTSRLRPADASRQDGLSTASGGCRPSVRRGPRRSSGGADSSGPLRPALRRGRVRSRAHRESLRATGGWSRRRTWRPRPDRRRSGSPGPAPDSFRRGVEPAALGGYHRAEGDFLRRLVAPGLSPHATHRPSLLGEGPAAALGRPSSSGFGGGDRAEGRGRGCPNRPSDRFAIEWIATRTGFPISSISSDMRLRDVSQPGLHQDGGASGSRCPGGLGNGIDRRPGRHGQRHDRRTR